MRTYPLRRFLLALVALSAFSCLSLAAKERWIEQRDPQFGYDYSYPEALFASAAGDGKPGFHYFAANASDAKFLVGAWDNHDGVAIGMLMATTVAACACCCA